MKNNSLKVQAFDIIKEKIVTCEYVPNTMLNEEMLRNEIGTSRTPIRDALSRLEQEGLIKILPKKGIMVSGLSISDINMIFEVRMLCEPYVLKNYGYAIPEKTMMQFLNAFSAQKPSCSDREYYELDDNFHKTIMDALPNRFLLKAYEWIHTQNLRYRIMTGKIQENRIKETITEHLSIVKACLSNDWSGAENAMIEHLKASKNSTFELLFNHQDGSF